MSKGDFMPHRIYEIIIGLLLILIIVDFRSIEIRNSIDNDVNDLVYRTSELEKRGTNATNSEIELLEYRVAELEDDLEEISDYEEISEHRIRQLELRVSKLKSNAY